MKTFITLLIPLILFSCQKEEPTCSDGVLNQDEVLIDCGGPCGSCPVAYPQYGLYGSNLLTQEDTLHMKGDSKSLHAVVPEGSSLKVELELIEGENWCYYGGTQVGWAISDYHEGHQLFDALNGGEASLRIVKCHPGQAQINIKFYENSSEVTRQTLLIWDR